MLISPAFAQDSAPTTLTSETATAPAADPAMAQPSTQSILLQNVGMIVLLVVMFYFLLIRPQQKRFKEHKQMIDALKPGDKVVTSGGLVGTLDKIVDDSEVIVDLGSTKVTVLRSMISAKTDKSATDKK